MYEPTRRNDAKEALDFAQRMAKQEIDSIERLHQRTIRQLSAVAAFFFALLGVIGWIGYRNLLNAATEIAKAQMHDEVVQQVQDKLKKDDLTAIVKDQVSNYSKTAMEGAIRKELQSPAITSVISRTAESETRTRIDVAFAPRHFTDKQCEVLVKAVKEFSDLNGYPVAVVTNVFNVEAADYGADIHTCLKRSNLKVLDNPNATVTGQNVDGFAIYRNFQTPDTFALHLQTAFEAAGVVGRIIAGSVMNVPPKGEQSSLNIWIGSKEVK